MTSFSAFSTEPSPPAWPVSPSTDALSSSATSVPAAGRFFGRSSSSTRTSVILGSGDLFTAEDCLRMIEQTGVDGVTVARGAIGNPWIFSQAIALARGEPLPTPTLAEQREVLRDHFRLAEELYGADRCGPLMRKFGIKYAAQHPRPLEVRAAFIRVRNRRIGMRWWTCITR